MNHKTQNQSLLIKSFNCFKMCEILFENRSHCRQQNKTKAWKRLLPMMHLVINPWCPKDSLALLPFSVFSVFKDYVLIINHSELFKCSINWVVPRAAGSRSWGWHHSDREVRAHLASLQFKELDLFTSEHAQKMGKVLTLFSKLLQR